MHNIETEGSKEEEDGFVKGLPDINKEKNENYFTEENKFIEDLNRDEEDSASKLDPPSFNHFEKEENTIDHPKF
jgi:hypothetical protein